MAKKLKILFVPVDAIGHMNAAIGMAEVLIASGHTAIFAINKPWKGRLTKYGIEEVLSDQDEDAKFDEDPAERSAQLFLEVGAIKSGTPLEIAINLQTKLMPNSTERQKKLDFIVDLLLKDIKPDVVIVDQVLNTPSVVLSGIPWVLVCSFNPLMFIDDKRTPPCGSGLPSKEHEHDCKMFRDTINEASLQMRQNWSDYMISRGLDPLEEHKEFHDSKYLNIYGFPLELDYLDLRPLPPKWYRFDNFMRSDKQSDFQLPDRLRGRPGKLIYFSLGSMGGADVELMKRLIAILSKCKHRFIVSKGTKQDKYELADNMWGQQSVPQIQVLSSVDLVITHGGNNTVTETFFFGKPMIVLPLFGDQPDNAQRIHEKGFGIRLSPYDCTEDELLNAIETLLNDKLLNEKLKNISKRIQSDNSITKLPRLIENLVVNNH